MNDDELSEGDHAYIEHCREVIHDSSRPWQAGEFIQPISYLTAIRDIATVCVDVLEGKRPSPWHDETPHGYLLAMKLAGEGRLEESLGPIEVIND